MRVDKLLDVLCIVKHRNIAKKACDNGFVKVNDQIAKPAKDVKTGDLVEVALYGFILKFEMTEIPSKHIKKSDAKNYYKLVVKNQVNENNK
ncbi:MAG: RNA-binding protein [Candidatus Cloacimonetes bacterium]|nr:RNA-binding protein [Candidatus Cloacimonadota bacterium]MBS3766724.1 RNA-binding protein [Candidatus Cloacimonadota bacterium]